jgi:hypothetical protein
MPTVRHRPPVTRRPGSRVLLTLCVTLAALGPAPAPAQNPISSKVVGSEVARRNRKLLSKFRARSTLDNERDAQADSLAPRSRVDRRWARAFGRRTTLERQLAAGEVADYLRLTYKADTARLFVARTTYPCMTRTLGLPSDLGGLRLDSASAVVQLERLCGTGELESVVPEALRLAMSDAYYGWKQAGSAQRRAEVQMQRRYTAAGQSGSAPPILDGRIRNAAYRIGQRLLDGTLGVADSAEQLERLAAHALDLVLDVVERGHTNPQRWFLGGQVGLRVAGAEDDAGLAARASVRAAYFVPVSPFRRWQLPIVTNLRDVAAAPEDEQAAKLKKVTTASEGAFLSVEPTWDPFALGPLKDSRFQPFLAIGGQVNTLKVLNGTKDSADVQLTQGRLGAGANIEFGTPSPGRPSLFLTSRVTWRLNSPGAWERVFGSRNRGTPVVETIALVPIGGATSLLAEVSASRNTKPVVRFGFWSQATPQSATQAADTPAR